MTHSVLPKFVHSPLTICKSILQFPDTRAYLAAKYPGLVAQIQEVVDAAVAEAGTRAALRQENQALREAIEQMRWGGGGRS